MPGEFLDFNSISRITIDATGPPGKRIFLLQASRGSSMVTLKLEKEQAKVLASAILELLDDLDEKYPPAYSKLDKPLSSDLMLQEPMEPVFIIGQIGLGYDREKNLIVLVIQELQLDEEQTELAAMRFWATRAQIKALADHTLEVVGRGRPICPLCDSPIDSDGHFCPRTNGRERTL